MRRLIQPSSTLTPSQNNGPMTPTTSAVAKNFSITTPRET